MIFLQCLKERIGVSVFFLTTMVGAELQQWLEGCDDVCVPAPITFSVRGTLEMYSHTFCDTSVCRYRVCSSLMVGDVCWELIKTLNMTN